MNSLAGYSSIKFALKFISVFFALICYIVKGAPFFASELVTVRAIDIIPLVLMTTKKPKGMDTVFIFEVVWLVACPVMEVKRSSITPHKRPFRVDISEAQPRMLPTMEVLNVDIFFPIVDAGKISTQN